MGSSIPPDGLPILKRQERFTSTLPYLVLESFLTTLHPKLKPPQVTSLGLSSVKFFSLILKKTALHALL